MSNDVFFKVGLITLIGLSAKNAILIIEFARQLRLQGKSTLEATLMASRQRLRPILMTSLAFTLGVVPLMIASGASASTQHAIGTGVFGGMISATVLSLFFLCRSFSLSSCGFASGLRGGQKRRETKSAVFRSATGLWCYAGENRLMRQSRLMGTDNR